MHWMHDLSIGEFDSLVLKAYRGAGFSWGMAQEAGRAAAWLALHGLPAGKYFAQLVQQVDGADPISLTPIIVHSHWPTDHLPLCPVVSGTVLSDHGLQYFASAVDDRSESGLLLGTIYSPIIILPFVSDCAQAAGVSLQVTADRCSIVVTPNGQCDISQGSEFGSKLVETITIRSVVNGQIEGQIEGQAACQTQDQSGSPTVCQRVSVSVTDLEILEQYAHRTYVPATEESRNSGAGAGLTDND